MFLCVAAALFLMPGFSEAAVTLVPRVDQSGTITPGEDYVYFGKFKHRLVDNTGSFETDATPVLWRVMSTDHNANPTKATLLTHYLVDARPYHATTNVWATSHLAPWLTNSSAFFENFSAVEQGLMLSPTLDGWISQVTIPSGEEVAGNYVGEIVAWFDSANSRKAHFKGASFAYDSANNGFFYWMRSPVNGTTSSVWCVDNAGGLSHSNVDYTNVAIRPAFFLDLQSVAFKSGSASSGTAGSINNPYFLYPSTVQPAVLTVASTTATPNTLTIKFASANIYNNAIRHIWKGAGPSGAGLAAKFTLTPANLVTQTVVNGDSLTLTVMTPLVPGTLPAIEYTATDTTDALGYVTSPGLVPTRMGTFTIPSASVSMLPWLSSLTLSSGTLSPVFTGSTTNYTADVANSVASITLTPTTGTPGATIEVDGQAVASGSASQVIALAEGSNTVTVTLTEGGDTTTYTLTITRAASSGGGGGGGGCQTTSALGILLIPALLPGLKRKNRD